MRRSASAAPPSLSGSTAGTEEIQERRGDAAGRQDDGQPRPGVEGTVEPAAEEEADGDGDREEEAERRRLVERVGGLAVFLLVVIVRHWGRRRALRPRPPRSRPA